MDDSPDEGALASSPITLYGWINVQLSIPQDV